VANGAGLGDGMRGKPIGSVKHTQRTVVHRGNFYAIGLVDCYAIEEAEIILRHL
jgi:hypothetical protein